MLKMLRVALAAAPMSVAPALAAASPFGVNLPMPTPDAGYFIDGMQLAAPWTADWKTIAGLTGSDEATSFDIITQGVASLSIGGGVVQPNGTTKGMTYKAGLADFKVITKGASRQLIAIAPVPGAVPVVHIIPTKWRERWNAGERLSPDLIERLRGFGTIRAMDAMATNGSAVTTTRPLPTDASYSGGLPVEVLADIANATGTDLVLNVPHLATDALTIDMIKAADKRLDPRLHLLIEPSNEVWNGAFPQSQWATTQGQATFRIAATPAVPAIGKAKAVAAVAERADPDALKKFYGAVAGRIALDIVKATGSATTGRVKLLLGWQFVGASAWPAIIQGYRATGASVAFIDAISAAVYPQGLIGANLTKWAASADFASANAQLDAWVVARAPNFAAHAAFARSIGVSFDLYEASIDQVTTSAPTIKDATIRPAVTDFAIKLTHSPEGVARFGRLMAAFEAAGGRTANYYRLTGPGSQYGVYGLFSDIQDATGYPAAAYVRDRNAAAWAAIPVKAGGGWLPRR